ncbi:class II histocompatibility antigen, B-L beta chain-like [Gouania willdenowi]|uniref:Class II histocompatibility antigen, B-L beta chain-like n=1 Tax=Gouania willdenowi TaxID=441366 RepID=A0A8C5I2C3_GOUWI|nr:class II histocompatibility antigen, B-L beta chain-like [Gouania willdenowi]
MKTHNLFSVLSLLLLVSRANAYFGYALVRCQFASTHDVVYLEQLFFNKQLIGEFNSTVGKYISFDEKLEPIVKLLNNNDKIFEHTIKYRELCKSKIPLVYDVLSTPVEPSVHLRLVKSGDDEHQGTLVCSVYNFYPKQIKVTWLRDGKEVTSHVTFTEVLASGNWRYQVNSQLEVEPAAVEQISCKVEHITLKKPKLYYWEPHPASEKGKIAAGSIGLIVGLIVPITGLFFYKKKTNGWALAAVSSD